MIKIATIEDEENIRQEIVRYIKKGIGSIEGVEVDVYESAERYLLVGGRYDLVISDIELPGISGLELGKRIKETNPDVYLVFLTSHSEFASESYIIEAYQYILKQDLEFRLPGVAEQLIEKLQKQKKEFCIIKDGTEQVKLLYKDILYLYKSKGTKYVNYVTTQGVVRERTSLENALKMLNSRQFLLVERGYAVNIKQICRVSGDTIYLEKGYEVPVSKARLAEVKREINLYWRNS